MLKTISASEAYEQGFTIANLDVLVIPRFEELYETPERAETIRRIALSQDEWSFQTTRYWLKESLLIRNPARRYNPDFDAIIDRALAYFYSGEESMSYFTSAAQVRQLSADSASRAAAAQLVVDEITAELAGITFKELPVFLADVIGPKYSEGWAQVDFARIVLDAVKVHARSPEFLAELKDIDPVSVPVLFSGYPELMSTSDYLADLVGTIAKGGLGPIPDVVPSASTMMANTEEDVKEFPWAVHEKAFETKTLKCGLVKRQSGTLMLEIGRKDAPLCYRFVVRDGKFIGVDDVAHITELLGDPAHIPMMLKYIASQFGA